MGGATKASEKGVSDRTRRIGDDSTYHLEADASYEPVVAVGTVTVVSDMWADYRRGYRLDSPVVSLTVLIRSNNCRDVRSDFPKMTSFV
jgi:hypothetical protein